MPTANSLLICPPQSGHSVTSIENTGITTIHGGYHPKKKITVARAAWRLDGWVSLDAGDTPGTVETVPMPAAGQRLIANVDAAGGELKAEVLDRSGAPIPGYGLADCLAVVEDGVGLPVRWETFSKLPSTGSVSIRFQFSNASLYSFSTT